MKMRARWLGLSSIAALVACAEVGSAPDVPAAIELSAFPSPAIIIGDTLRDSTGAVAPIEAIVRNVQGDVIADATIRYLYADFGRDSALAVDSVTGIVRALKTATGTTSRLAARVGLSLQVLRTIAIIQRPDSLSAPATILPLFTTTLADTGRTGATQNTSADFAVVVRHVDSVTAAATTVASWPVRFELLSPANATNDTTRAVFLVNESGRPSTLDTTDNSGNAARRVRIRAASYPSTDAVDTVVVRAVSSYKGVLLRGAPIRMVLPVKRGTSGGS
ncbi:MAG: hypothetical protein IT353_09935 [Gemmatimonadaceae bacterium]|nr:hypothetical protein [Gemmatimonadaceae bacterium]